MELRSNISFGYDSKQNTYEMTETEEEEGSITHLSSTPAEDVRKGG